MGFKLVDMECPRCGHVETDVLLGTDEKKMCHKPHAMTRMRIRLTPTKFLTPPFKYPTS